MSKTGIEIAIYDIQVKVWIIFFATAIILGSVTTKGCVVEGKVDGIDKRLERIEKTLKGNASQKRETATR